MTTARVNQPVAVDPAIGRARQLLITAPVVVGALTIAVLLIIVPWGERNQLGYEALAPLRDAAWTGILVDSVAMIAVGVGLSLVVCQLARARGAVWANIGAVLTTAGSALFGLGAFAFAALLWHVTDPTLIDPSDGSALLDYAVANPQHAMVIQMIGFLTFTVGMLVLCVALLRARTVPAWLPIAVIVLTVALFVSPPRVTDFVQAAQMLAVAGIGVAYLHSARTVRD